MTRLSAVGISEKAREDVNNANARRVAKHTAMRKAMGQKRVSFWVEGRQETIIREWLKLQAAGIKHLAPLPELFGSDKQINWALEIRQSTLSRINEMLVKTSVPVEIEAIKTIARNRSAHWWIEHRHMSVQAMLAEEVKRRTERFSPPPTDDTTIKQLLAETTLRPAKGYGPVAELSVADLTVRAALSTYDETANAVLKIHGFRWQAPYWERAVEHDESAENCAVELAVKLLAQGCCVRIFNDALRHRVIDNDYIPEPKRRIDVARSEKYGTKFRVIWDTPDERACRSMMNAIKGAALFKTGGGAFVQLCRYEDIEDLLAISGFTIDDDARELIEKERAKRNAMLGVTPKVKHVTLPQPGGLPTGKIGVIDASLADD